MAVETVQVARHLFNVDEYHRMAEAGILGEDDRVELIEGEIVDMSPIGKRHAGTVNRLVASLYQLLGNRVVIAVQNPILLTDDSEPQPDIAVLAFRDDYYAGSLPTPKDTLFVIEVADTTVVTDRTLKLPLYARAGVPEAWVVNLQDEQIEVYSQPSGSEYRQQNTFGQGDTVAVPGFPDISLEVKRILG